MDAQADNNKNRAFALLFAIGFHAALFLAFIFIVFITPIPPFEIIPPPEIEIGLSGMEGMGDPAAGGSSDANDNLPKSVEDSGNPTPENNTAPNVITDDTETEAAVKTNPNSKVDPKTEETAKEEKASEELMAALQKARNKKKGAGQGNNNTGGSGDGTGKGIGDGNADQQGNGPNGGSGGQGSYDLGGRKRIKKPDRLTDATEEGVVVVEITVDETGKVIKAVPGKRGSTTTSSVLLAKARQAALTVKFDPSPEGVKEQVGTYTFVFTLE
ncbi:MAG: energy transducer TonB [Bacteroidota bacterium]|nr:energy transducer TonB [Bacteroidota bacterium]